MQKHVCQYLLLITLLPSTYYQKIWGIKVKALFMNLLMNPAEFLSIEKCVQNVLKKFSGFCIFARLSHIYSRFFGEIICIFARQVC